jgi:hypothetical protein
VEASRACDYSVAARHRFHAQAPRPCSAVSSRGSGSGWCSAVGNGHVYSGPAPTRLEVLQLSDDSDGGAAGAAGATPLLRVTFAGGETADYADVAATELWAAYHFVEGMSIRTGGKVWKIPGNAAGLVGMTRNDIDGWQFAVHPAIARTHLARDAMRLDMLIVAAEEPGEESLPPGLRQVHWQDVDFETYQWYDAPARIAVTAGRISVEPESGPPKSIMRVLLYGTEEPPRGQTALNSQMDSVYAGFDALRAVDRLARVVAILNWYRSAHAALPRLPAFVTPVTEEVPASWAWSGDSPGRLPSGALATPDR